VNKILDVLATCLEVEAPTVVWESSEIRGPARHSVARNARRP
jgi:hypothetical protein